MSIYDDLPLDRVCHAPLTPLRFLDRAEQYFADRTSVVSGEIALTLPLHDNNGEKVAAVRLVMKSFVGQTENNALARAMPVVKGMEMRIQTLKDLVQ